MSVFKSVISLVYFYHCHEVNVGPDIIPIG